jgi:hypothetical protein
VSLDWAPHEPQSGFMWSPTQTQHSIPRTMTWQKLHFTSRPNSIKSLPSARKGLAQPPKPSAHKCFAQASPLSAKCPQRLRPKVPKRASPTKASPTKASPRSARKGFAPKCQRELRPQRLRPRLRPKVPKCTKVKRAEMYV